MDVRYEFLQGLTANPKRLSPALLWDKRGSQLFEQEKAQPEYYLPDAEAEIFQQRTAEIVQYFQESTVIIEPGCGACDKVRRLLDASKKIAGYVGIDISSEFFEASSRDFQKVYPHITTEFFTADFLKLDIDQDRIEALGDNRIVFMPGSTIGNFSTKECITLLKNFASLAGDDGLLLLGIDLAKDRKILEHAYNDEAGVAERLHLNLLERANRELRANFNISNFTYQAEYNSDHKRVEMFLISQYDQTVLIGEDELQFYEGERINTNYSHKYTLAEVEELAQSCGLSRLATWIDSHNHFSLQLFAV